MKKALTIVVLLVAVALVAAPAAAKKGGGGPKPTTPPTTEEPTAADLVDCAFDAAGVLVFGDDPDDRQVWTGDEPLFCEYFVADADLPAQLKFKIEAIPGMGNRAFTGGHLSFKEEHPGSDFCYREFYDGRQDGSAGVDFPRSDGDYAVEHNGYVVLPGLHANGEQCDSTGSVDLDGHEVFTLSVHVTKTQGGPVWLRMTDSVFGGSGA